MAEEWKLQVSFKTASGTLINARGNTPEEVAQLIQGVSELAVEVVSVERLLGGVTAVAPLSTGTITLPSAPPPVSNQGFPATPPVASGPTCMHGPRKHKSGISGPNAKTPGQPYSMWTCPLPQGPEQCKPTN